jgi:membrane dipeptidase
MAHRSILQAIRIVATLLALSGGTTAHAAEPTDEQVRAAHAAALVVDAHLDLPPGFATEKNDPGVDGPSQVDLPKLERGGVDVAVLAVFAWQQARTPEQDAIAMATGREKLAAIRRATEWYPSRLALVRSPDEVVQAAAAGRRAAMVSVLNATVLGPKAERLDEYYAAGMRQLGFTHASHNAYADSSRPLPKNGDGPTLWGGLSPLGRALVPRLNDLGVILDVSQLSDAATAEVLALSRAPVIASHSAVRARVDTARNLSDGQLRAIAAKGGVVHVVAFSSYLLAPPPAHERDVAALRAKYGVADDAAVARLPPERAAEYQKEYFGLVRALPKANVGHLVDAIDHVVKLVGIEHVGIATDFEHAGGVDGYRNEGEAPNVTRELLRRGYSADDVAKIWGGNWLRVFREVERLRRS